MADQALVALLAALVLVAGAFDWATRRIPNWLSLITGLAGLALAVVAEGLPQAASHGLHFLVASAAGLLLFRFGVIGGGDAKLYMGVAAWFPVDQAVLLALAITIAGVLLVVVHFSIGRFFRRKIDKEDRTAGLPYGIAIAAGTIATKCLL